MQKKSAHAAKSVQSDGTDVTDLSNRGTLVEANTEGEEKIKRKTNDCKVGL